MSAAIARDATLSIHPTSTELCNASDDIMHLVGEAQVLMCNDEHSAISTVLVAPGSRPAVVAQGAVSYTHLTLPTNREV